MKPSSRRIWAMACFVREAGTSTLLWFAVFAFRMRVSISAIGSVIDIYSSPHKSPRPLRDTRHDARVRVLTKADAAHRKLAQIAARAPADSAPVVLPHAELRRPLRLDDQTRLCHRPLPLLPLGGARRLLQWKTHRNQKIRGLFVRFGRRHDRDVHAAGLVDLVVVDLGKHQLLAQTEIVVSTPVERLRRKASEVANARQHDVEQLVDEDVHAIAAQRYLRAEVRARAQLERGDGFLRLRNDGLLTRDRGQLAYRGVQRLRVDDRLPDAHVHDDLLEPRDLIDVLISESLLQLRTNLLI